MLGGGTRTISAKVGVAFIILGATLAAIGLTIWEPAIGGAVGLFGIAAIVGGVDSVVTRRHRTGQSFSSDLPREHVGASAAIFGLTFIAAGLVLAVAGFASMIGLGDELWSQVADRAGLAVMVVGVGICLIGIATLISRWTYVDTSTVWWQRLPGMALGAFLIAMGVATVFVGRSLAVDPPASDEVLERILDTLAGWLGGD